MSAATKILNGIWITFVILVVGMLVFGSITQQPILYSYAISDSMVPLLPVGDLFFIVTKPFVHIHEGDIIVYQSDKSGFLVHRVITETPEGYVTKGDNSPLSDQQAGEPLVPQNRITGKILTIQGKPITIAQMGNVLNYLQNLLNRYKLFVIGGVAVLGLVTLFTDDLKKTRRRRKTLHKVRLKQIGVPLVLFLSVAAIITMLLQQEKLIFSYWVLQANIQSSEVEKPGSDFSREVELQNNGYLPQFVVVQISSASAPKTTFRSLMPGEISRINLNFTAPKNIGAYSESVRVYRYLPLLPARWMQSIFSISPYLLVMLVAILLVSPLVIVIRVFGPNEIIGRQWR